MYALANPIDICNSPLSLHRPQIRTARSSTECKSRRSSRLRSQPTGMLERPWGIKGLWTETNCRYDLLCFEGIALMLNIFLGRKPLPEYKLTQPAQLQEIIVKEDVGAPRYC